MSLNDALDHLISVACNEGYEIKDMDLKFGKGVDSDSDISLNMKLVKTPEAH